ncbi:hypothetical protein ColLi_09849 [Colletotrichum liriopes]|uniref:Uncharacterized protein n=1 Tax=Colletotrichum liriopes TaxID=708192 RepID=A0AA37LWP9_9PEZI|nr:hypothetical protein ColLi_09849 [Colletotrichum liriopes]
MLPGVAFYEAVATFLDAAWSKLDDSPRVNDGMSWIYYDNIQYISNASNVVKIAWADVQPAFEKPAHTDTATYTGVDWTKPFPGESIDGFQAHLRIANDVPFPESVEHGVFTELAAITYSLPESMTKDGLPKAMDPSWYICQHYMVTTKVDPTKPVDHACGFLPDECRADLEASLAEEWGIHGLEGLCGRFALEYVPVSCQDYLGWITQDVTAYGSDLLKDADVARAAALEEVSQGSWMLGTGYVDAGNVTAYYAASNRTYIVGTVFGYRFSVEEERRQTPRLSLACLRPEWVEPPQPTATAEAASATPLALGSSSGP